MLSSVMTDSANAFALPGGYVYVTRGIMAYMDSEADLAGVIGHEIGHLTARHGAQRATIERPKAGRSRPPPWGPSKVAKPHLLESRTGGGRPGAPPIPLVNSAFRILAVDRPGTASDAALLRARRGFVRALRALPRGDT